MALTCFDGHSLWVNSRALAPAKITRATPDPVGAGTKVGIIMRDAAFAEFTEKTKGTLEPGKLADLVVLSQDLFRVAPLEIRMTKAVLTVVGGKVVYREGV